MAINTPIIGTTPPTEMELHLVELEPPGLLPTDQSSYYGQLRAVFGAVLQVLADQHSQWYLNLNPATVDANDMENWEIDLGIPVSTTKALETRRSFVLSRAQRGPFTYARRRAIVETFLSATTGDPPSFGLDGIGFDDDGIPFYSGISDVSLSYQIIENIPAFSYTVYILDTVDVDTVGLTRELARITPSPITFTISSVSELPLLDTFTDSEAPQMLSVYRPDKWAPPGDFSGEELVTNADGTVHTRPSSGGANRWIDDYGNDSFVQYTVRDVVPNGTFGLVVRSNEDMTSCYAAFCSPENGTEIYALTPDGDEPDFSTVASFDMPFNTNDKLKLQVVGTAVKFYKNGTLIHSATDSTVTTGNYTGVIVEYQTGTFNEFISGIAT